MILNLHSRIPMIHFYLRPLTASLGLGSWEVINDPYVSRIISFSLLSPSLILSVTISPDDHPLLGIQQTFIEGLLCARHCVKSQGNKSPFPWGVRTLLGRQACILVITLECDECKGGLWSGPLRSRENGMVNTNQLELEKQGFLPSERTRV